MMPHTKYQDSWTCGFRQEDLLSFFPYISLSKICDPRGGGLFGTNLNKLDRGRPDDATYQNSRL